MIDHATDAQVLETVPQQRLDFVDRRRSTATPTPNPGRRASDRDAYLAELAREDERNLVQIAPRWLRRYRTGLVLTDLASAAAAAAVLAVTVQTGSAAARLLASALFVVGWLLLVASTRAYEPRFLGTGTEEYRRTFDAAVRYAALLAIGGFATTSDMARGYVFLALPVTLVLSLLLRWQARRWLLARRRAGACAHRVVLVGSTDTVRELLHKIRRGRGAGFQVLGVCLTDRADGVIDDVPVLGGPRDIVTALSRTTADTVAVAADSGLSSADLRRLAWRLEDSAVTMMVAPAVTDVAGPRINIRPVAGLPLLHVEQPEFRGTRRVAKGALDRLAAGAAILMLTPLLLAVAVIVRLSSPGPALFRQERVGLRGTSFSMFKFRSMYVDAEARLTELRVANEAADSLLFKMRDDPRVTPVGRWLRRFSLDELPQLFNVLLGHMSLVGPRPPLPEEVERYGGDVPRRLLVKPGVTGLWQVSGRSNLSWEESVRLDLHYVENWSPALDVLICWKTLFAVLRREGAY